jgi:hypothetical protein
MESAARTGPELVVASAGAGPATTLAASQRLAALLALPLAPWPETGTATSRLAAQAERGGPWLAPLLQDPGQWLEPDGRWADALGAWRQPTVLLVEAAEAAKGGRAAAYSALLESSGVPLVGLVQWGGSWDRQARRREGLAWLGALSGEAEPPAGSMDEEQELALARALVMGWERLVRN